MSEEISLSIEETNALRAKLGIKPLRIESAGSGQTGVLPWPPVTELKLNQKEVSEKEENKRLVSDLTGGGGILDIFGDVDAAADWVKRQRKSHTGQVDGSGEDSSDSESDSSQVSEGSSKSASGSDSHSS